MSIRHKIVGKLSACLLSMFVGASCLVGTSLPAFAEDADVDPPTFTVVLSFDTSSTQSASVVCYPNVTSATDLDVTITVGGQTYTGELQSGSGRIRAYSFSELTAAPETCTLTLHTNTDEVASYVNIDDIEAYKYKFMDATTGAISASKTLKAADWSCFDPADSASDALEEVNIEIAPNKSYTFAADVSASDFGLCSILIGANLDNKSTAQLYADRQSLTSVPYAVTAVVNDKTMSTSMPFDGVTYYRVPVKWDPVASQYDRTCNVVFNTVRMTSLGSSIFEGSTVWSVPFAGTCANEDWLDAQRILETKAGHDKTPEELLGLPENNEATEADFSEYNAGFKFNVTSSLASYDTSLASVTPFVNLRGQATETKLALMRTSYAVGDIMTWHSFDVYNSGVENVQVDAGAYTLEGSSNLELTYDGSLTAKESQYAKVAVNVAPHYTLTLTSLAGNINCDIGSNSFSGKSEMNFMLDGNTEYIVTDKTSGKVYKAVATDETPHISLKLGSNDGVIGTTNPKIDDVPNTADPIVIIAWVFGGILLLFGGSFYFVWRAGKKAEGRK